jgi:hypothetical protein
MMSGMGEVNLPSGASSSAGALRERSCRLFDTACSRNEDLVLVFLRLREKLSVCDLFGFRLNILGSSFRYFENSTAHSLTFEMGDVY